MLTKFKKLHRKKTEIFQRKVTGYVVLEKDLNADIKSTENNLLEYKKKTILSKIFGKLLRIV
jgi:hypothetical protein